MRESPVEFGNGRALVGVITESDSSFRTTERPGAIFLNAGLIHRVGANRLYVTLARNLAAKGISSLRFDLSGIGDSPASRDTASIHARRLEETRAAMRTLGEATGANRFLLFGHCSGAFISFRVALADPRVAGLGLLNPPGKLMVRHFVRTFLRHPAAWRRLFVGQATIARQLRRFLREGRARPQPRRNGASAPRDVLGSLSTLAARDTHVLIVYSEWDTGYDYYHHALRRPLGAANLRDRVRTAIIAGADHNFSLVAHQREVIDVVDRWTDSMREAFVQ